MKHFGRQAGGSWGAAILMVGLGLAGRVGHGWAAPEPVAAPKVADAPGVWWHDEWLQGLDHRGLDVENARAVFAVVFAHLPDHVRVMPTENYFYWKLAAAGRQLHGNIRLAVGGRERGEVAFAYGEPLDFLDDVERSERLAVAATLTETDGVRVRLADAFTVVVSHAGKHVTFHLNRLEQVLPDRFPLAAGEKFLQRTHDESGLRFLLLYNTRARYFFWVLDESEGVPETWRTLAPDTVIGRRTGFVFWSQQALGNRKILASVRQASLRHNDYHDGPFDQLADNFVQGDGLRPYLEEAMPWLQGRVDRWGGLTDRAAPRRVALTCHGRHERTGEAVALIAAARSQTDPVAHLSRGGRPATGDSPASDTDGQR